MSRDFSGQKLTNEFFGSNLSVVDDFLGNFEVFDHNSDKPIVSCGEIFIQNLDRSKIDTDDESLGVFRAPQTFCEHIIFGCFPFAMDPSDLVGGIVRMLIAMKYNYEKSKNNNDLTPLPDVTYPHLVRSQRIRNSSSFGIDERDSSKFPEFFNSEFFKVLGKNLEALFDQTLFRNEDASFETLGERINRLEIENQRRLGEKPVMHVVERDAGILSSVQGLFRRGGVKSLPSLSK